MLSSSMLSDIEIAQAAKLKPIVDVASALGIASLDLIPYGHYIAKISANCLNKLQRTPHLNPAANSF